jgi:hypothetical protein
VKFVDYAALHQMAYCGIHALGFDITTESCPLLQGITQNMMLNGFLINGLILSNNHLRRVNLLGWF